ncbi:MAG: helix-turn-helix transcriptional regulator [Deltaproteobacteria bacterium]|nr:helix-turn-helix transcriptional regulator [Deltaproteobacteria bacterium]
MKSKTERFKSVRDFGRALGLSDVEMQMIRQKKKLIQRLKDARTKKGLSQAEVAHLVGSKQPAIARMEAGQVSQVSMDFLLRAALVLGLSVTIKPGRIAA